MDEEKKGPPPPTIKDTPPPKPPTTSADSEPKKEVKPAVEDSAPEEVEESTAPANLGEPDLGNRIIGGLIDGLVVAALSTIVSLILPAFLSSVANLVGIAYLLTRDSLPFLDGQSLGKKVIGARAVREDGTPLTGDYKTGVTRNAWMLLGIVELIVLIVRKDKPEAGRRLGDDFAKTKVIKVD